VFTDNYGETSEGDGLAAVMFAIFIVPIIVLLIYPRTDTFLNGIGNSGGKQGYLYFSLIVIHGIGFYMILRGIRQRLSQGQNG
jgi:hypothetical protein|tara:strand:- start:86 stop:334 length:249 start_codon:yes stop_codon:yes gene_type:complete